MTDTELLDWFETIPKHKQNDILNNTEHDTFRGKLEYYYGKAEDDYIDSLIGDDRSHPDERNEKS